MNTIAMIIRRKILRDICPNVILFTTNPTRAV